jgi:DNA helicase-2/ATP-dependent DNA helicase PcrA
MPSALRAAVDLARFAPETRERIATFLEVYGELALALEQLRPDELVHRVIARTGLQRARLLSSEAQAVEALVGLARVEELASHFVRFSPHGSGRDFADYLTYAAEAGLSLEELVPGAADAERGSGDALVEVMSGDVLPANAFDHVYVVGLGAPRGNGRGSPGRSLLDASGGAPGELLAERLPAGSDLRSPGDLRWSLYRAICAARGRVVLVHVARDADRRAQAPPGAAEDARVALGARWENRQPPALEEGQVLDGAARILRQRALEDVARIGGRLGELRLDTDYDISHGVVRYLELLKLASLLERPPGQSFSDALLDLNARLLSACTPLEREIFESSPLDEALIAGLPGGASSLAGGLGSPAQIGASAATAAAHLVDTPEDSLLAAFLPRRGDGLVLSASDIETYRACPLRYKLARVLRIPAEPTPQQRFGIMVHKVLERYHSGWDGTPADMGKTLATLMRLLEGAWRRSGFRESPGELALLSKARDALTRYHGQLAERPGRPVWFERSFSFSVGPHLIRGRVDRIDQVPDDGYELIDYKTGHPRSPAQLEGDVQLSLYALAARRAWNLPATREAYYYVLDNRKVPLPHQQDDAQLEWVTDTIMSVGEGILALQFRPTPAYSVCSSCDYLTICPAAEA